MIVWMPLPTSVMIVWMPLGGSLEAPWDPFGAFDAHRCHFCFEFGLQNGSKIYEFWEALTRAKCGK